MKILYAASNRTGAALQLQRYVQIFSNSQHEIKIATFSHPLISFNYDYCLDALLNFLNPTDKICFNSNFSYYCKELIKFQPDLIISDFELYTSIFAIENNIPLWQVSPLLLYYGLPKQLKSKTGIHKNCAQLISGNRNNHQYIKNILRNSQRKIIPSCLCDLETVVQLINGFEWCRPEFQLYPKNIKENFKLSKGYGTNLNDNFYNHLYNIIDCDWNDLENIICSLIYSYFGLGDLKTQTVQNTKEINIKLNENIKFLMDLL